MMYQNVPVPNVVAKFGGGYVGAQQAAAGHALGEEAVKRFGLKKRRQGDRARTIRSTAEALRARARQPTAMDAAGLEVTKIVSPPEWPPPIQI